MQQLRPPKATSFSAMAHLRASAAAAEASVLATAADASITSGLSAAAAPVGLPGRLACIGGEQQEPVTAAAAEEAEAEAGQQPQPQQVQQQLLLPQLVSKLALHASLSLPDSPQSALHFQRASSLKTVSSEAGSLLASGANGSSTDAQAGGQEAAAELSGAGHMPLASLPLGSAAASEPETPSARKAADSVVDLARRAPGLLLQVQQLLDRSPVPLPPSNPASASCSLLAPTDGDAEAEERGYARRLTRRAADQGCSEELRSFGLADDSAGSTPRGAPRLRASAVWGGGGRPSPR